MALRRTTEEHRDRYHEICASDRRRFVMLGAELGGRLSTEALAILRRLAEAKSREVPTLLQRRAQRTWHRRWLGIVSVAVQVATAESLLDPASQHRSELDGATPAFSELLGRDSAAAFSRLPLRG